MMKVSVTLLLAVALHIGMGAAAPIVRSYNGTSSAETDLMLMTAEGHLQKETRDWCGLIRELLPPTCILSEDCFRFECALDVVGQPLLVGATLGLCASPASAAVYVTAPGVDFKYTIQVGTPVFTAIPGLALSVELPWPVGSIQAGGMLVGSIDGNLAALEVQSF